MKSQIATLLKVLLSAGLIVFLFSRVDAGEVGAALGRARADLFAVALLLYLGAIASNALKWQILLRAQGVAAPFRGVLRNTLVAVFFNNFMPFLGTDVVRGYSLARETAKPELVAISVVADRLIGLLVLVSVGAAAALFAVRVQGLDNPALLLVAQGGLIGTLALLAGICLLLSARMRHLLEAGLARLPLLRAAVPLVARLSTAVGAYRRQPGVLFSAYAVGLLTILLSNGVNWLLFSAIGQTVSFLHVSVFNPILGLAMALPISIGGLGVNQSLIPWFYGLVGVEVAPAVAMSLLLQVLLLLISLPGGGLWAMQRGTPAPMLPEAGVAPQPGKG
jgi:glycosyltransferase 2 family protein